MVQLLLKHGATGEPSGFVSDSHALSIAAIFGLFDIVDAIIQAGHGGPLNTTGSCGPLALDSMADLENLRFCPHGLVVELTCISCSSA